MTKRKYLRRLRRALGNIPAYEKDDIVAYYDELIEESFDRGKTAREVFADLDSPERAAENYLREGTPYGDRAGRRERKSGWSAVTLPFRIILGFALCILFIVIVSVTFALGVAGFATGISGIYAFIMMFGMLFTGHVGIAFAELGTAIALMGISGLLCAAIRPIWRLNSYLWSLALGKERRTMPKKGRGVRMILISAAELFGGILIFVAAFGGLGFDRNRLAVTEGIEEHDEVVTESIENFTFDTNNLSLTVHYSDSEEIRLVYRDVEEDRKQYSYENGTMSLRETRDYDFIMFGTSFRLQWTRGIFFSAVTQDLYKAELWLPESFCGDFTAKSANGVISISDMVCANLVLGTNNGLISLKNVQAEDISVESDNGLITFYNVTSAGNLRAKTDNGAVNLENVTAQTMKLSTSNGAVNMKDVAAEQVDASTSNGAVLFERLAANSLDLRTNNGAIRGSIVGTMSEYVIDAHTDIGSCNLQNKTDGDKRLYARTGNGAIDITFTA